MLIQIGCRAETLDERDGAGRGLGALASGLLDQKCGNDPVDDLQDGREQLRMTGASSSGCVANSKRSRIGNESTHWRTAPGDDVINQAGARLCHAPGATARAEAATLTTEGHELFMGTVGATRRRKPRAKMPQSRKASNWAWAASRSQCRSRWSSIS